MNSATNTCFILLCTVTLAGCPQLKEAPPAPAVRPDGQNRNWTNLENMVYTIGDTEEKIIVPKGFVTDFASIPEQLWSFGLSPHGQYSRAAVIHDYLYWSQGCTRDQADRIMVIAMKESKVGGFDEFAIYNAVHFFGENAWKQNQSEREIGIPRVVPDNYLRPADPNMTWDEYRKYLMAQGVRDPKFENSPSYCVYGNSTEIPKSSAATQEKQRP